MIVLFDTIIITIVLVALIAASINDIKKREVPNWISYGLLFFILITRTLQAIITNSPKHFYYTLIAFIIFAIFGNIMYFTKQWGGGDTKLITSLGAAFAIKPFYLKEILIPFPIILIVNILIIGALYGLIYALFLAIKHKKQFKKQFVKMNSNPKLKKVKALIIILAISIIGTYFIYPINQLRFHIGTLSIIMLLLPYLFIFIKSVELSCMYKKIPTTKLTEGDWVEKNIYKNNKLIYKINPYGINKKQINQLKKLKIKQVLIKEGIPFIPSFLLGTIITLILGNIMFFSSIFP